MRIKGVETGARTIEVHLPVSDVTLSLRVKPLPYGFDERVRKELGVPKPPSKQIRNRRGEPVLLYDERDPEYLAEQARVNTLALLVTLRFALAEDENIEWDAPLDTSASFKQLAAQTDAELRKVEFPMADIMILLDAVARGSGISADMLEEKAADFSSRGIRSAPGSDSPSPPNGA